MANLSHVFEWDELRNIFICRTGVCGWSKTWDEVEKAGYIPRKVGVIFVKEGDFKYE